jgi:hypothetical protein
MVMDRTRPRLWFGRLSPRTRRWGPAAGIYLACAAAAAEIWAPVAAERAVQGLSFSDRLGTFPVQVSLCHDGRSTLDTGVFGKVFWAQTGASGFGAYARATGPPEAGGTLASYVDPRFIRANVALINDPDTVVDAYSARFEEGLRSRVLRDEPIAAIIGGAVLFALLPRRRLREAPAGREVAVALVLVAVATGASTATAVQLFHAWPCSKTVTAEYAMPGVDRLSFESPQTREVAEQVRPAIEKNIQCIEEGAQRYEVIAQASFASQLQAHAAALRPRAGETMVLAEADPQGSFVGTRVRTAMYQALVEALGPQAISLRTISGDVSSNGTVAESGYIADESKASGDIPTVAIGGDHDSETTWKQMSHDDIQVSDLKPVEVAGIRVSGANDREHKTLFGGIITNKAGIGEQELGAQLRATVDDQPQIVLLHQPDAVAGYLGLDSLSQVVTSRQSHRPVRRRHPRPTSRHCQLRASP